MAGEAVIGIRLTADGSGFVGEVNVSREALTKLRGETEKVKPAAESSFGGATSAVKNFLGVIAAGSFTSFIKRINAADAALVDLSAKTGISIEELSRYDKVVAVSGKSMNELADYSVKLGQSLMTAVEMPTSDAARAMKVLGFTSEETARLMRHPEEALQRVAGQMGKFQDGTQKNAVAMALFGKQGKDIVPVLSDIATHTRDVSAVSEEQAAKSKQLETNFALMKVEANNLGREFLTGLMPALTEITGSFDTLSGKESVMKNFGEGVGEVFKAVAIAAGFVSTGVQNLSVTIAALVEAATSAASFDMDGVKRAWELRGEMIDENNAKLKEYIASLNKTSEAEKNVYAIVMADTEKMMSILRAANKEKLNFQKKEEDARSKQIKSAEDHINKLREEVAVIGLDEIAKKRLQAANLGVAASAEKYIKKLEDQKKKTDALAEATKLLSFEEKRFNDWLKTVEITAEDLNKIRDDALKSSQEHLDKLEQEIRLMGLSNEEREVTIALLEAEKKRVGLTTEAYEDYRKAVEDAVRRKYALEQAIKEQEEIRREWQKTTDQINQTLTDAIMRGFESGKSFAQNFKDAVINIFKTMVLRPIVQFSVQGGMNVLGSLFGGGGGGGGGGFGNLFSGISSLFGSGGTMAGQSFFSTFSSVFSQGLSSLFGQSGMFSSIMGGGAGGLATTFASSGLGQMLGLSTQVAGPTVAGGTATALTGAGQALVKMVPVIGWILTGMMTNLNLYKQGWDAGGQQKDLHNRFMQNPAGLGLASIMFNDKLFRSLGLGGKWASILSGSSLVVRAFGHKKPEARGGGVMGTLGRDGFDGEMYQDFVAKGGWFRSDKWSTETAPMNRAMRLLINNTIGKVPQQISDMLEEFGKDFATVIGDDWSKWYKINLADKGNWDEIEARLAEETTRVYRDMSVIAIEAIREGWGKYVSDLKDLDSEQFYAEMHGILLSLSVLDDVKGIQDKIFGVSGLVIENFEALADTGELIYETIARLADTFTSTNRLAKLTGIQFSGMGLDSAATRQALVDDAGGADALLEITDSYWRTFATQAEQFAASKDILTEAFDVIGVSIPRTAQAYRDLVAAQDMSTEEGRKAALQLMQAAGLWQQTAGVFEAMKTNFSNSIDDMRRAFELDGLSNQEKYNKLKAAADAAWIELQTATDPEEITRLINAIQRDMSGAWGLLDDDQKRAKREEYLRKLDELEAMGLDRIDVAQSEFFGVDVASKNVADALTDLAQTVFSIDDAIKSANDYVGAPTDVLSALKPIMEEAINQSKPLAVDTALSVLKPLLEERGISDPGEMSRMIEYALKPLLEAQESSGDRYIETLQFALDKINESAVASIDASGVSKELEGSGARTGKILEEAGSSVAGAFMSGARAIIAAASVPQRVSVEVITPTYRPSEAN
ncbi:MAG: hypothetical protein LBI35_06470 [Burkholderiales bacterium]|nr:hypothetical protein [Burkholderiales bacterium]